MTNQYLHSIYVQQLNVLVEPFRMIFPFYKVVVSVILFKLKNADYIFMCKLSFTFFILLFFQNVIEKKKDI